MQFAARIFRVGDVLDNFDAQDTIYACTPDGQPVDVAVNVYGFSPKRRMGPVIERDVGGERILERSYLLQNLCVVPTSRTKPEPAISRTASLKSR